MTDYARIYSKGKVRTVPTYEEIKAQRDTLLEAAELQLMQSGHLNDCPGEFDRYECVSKCSILRAAIAQAKGDAE